MISHEPLCDRKIIYLIKILKWDIFVEFNRSNNILAIKYLENAKNGMWKQVIFKCNKQFY